MAKRRFTIDIGAEKIPVEGHEPRNVAVKYLMKRRRSLLVTKDKDKAENMFQALPRKITIEGTRSTKSYEVKWERVATGEFQGARFAFTLEEVQ